MARRERGAEEGAQGFQNTSRRCAEVRTEPCQGAAVRQACCVPACMGLCAELERPRFASDSELTATPWSPSPCKLRFKVRQKQRTPCRISHCWWCSKAGDGFCWGNERAGTGQ